MSVVRLDVYPLLATVSTVAGAPLDYRITAGWVGPRPDVALTGIETG